MFFFCCHTNSNAYVKFDQKAGWQTDICYKLGDFEPPKTGTRPIGKPVLTPSQTDYHKNRIAASGDFVQLQQLLWPIMGNNYSLIGLPDFHKTEQTQQQR